MEKQPIIKEKARLFHKTAKAPEKPRGFHFGLTAHHRLAEILLAVLGYDIRLRLDLRLGLTVNGLKTQGEGSLTPSKRGGADNER